LQYFRVERIREKRHRLPLSTYRGRVVVAFTINAIGRTGTQPEGCGYSGAEPLTASLVYSEIFDVARRALDEAFRNNGGHCGVYVFMPDHVHLIVSGAGPESDLHAMVKEFKQKTTYRLRRTGREFGWQKDFYDHIIREGEDYGAQVRYVLCNPVRRGLCERWEEWALKGVLGQTWEELKAGIVAR
jgi:REP element-mobilizing transposase RayT